VVFLTTYQKMGLAFIPKLDQFQCFFNLEDGKASQLLARSHLSLVTSNSSPHLHPQHCNVDVLIDQLASALVCIEMGEFIK